MELTLTYTTVDNKQLDLRNAWIQSHEFKDNVGYVTLRYINIPKSLFEFKDTLTSVVIPNGVTSIDDYAFWDCTSLTNVTMPNSLRSIGTWAFAHSSIPSVHIPNSVERIGIGAFYACQNLVNLEIPNSVICIGSSAFRECRSITNIKIPNSVTEIPPYTFAYCEKLMSIEIPNSVTHIGDNAFVHCSDLTSVAVPNSVTYIGPFAFGACKSLPCCQINLPKRSILAYKGFRKDMSCKNFKYEIGKSYHEDVARVCDKGFHACLNPIDTLSYYPNINEIRYALVELSGTIDFSRLTDLNEDTKLSATDIKIIKEVSFKDLIQEFNRLNK